MREGNKRIQNFPKGKPGAVKEAVQALHSAKSVWICGPEPVERLAIGLPVHLVKGVEFGVRKVGHGEVHVRDFRVHVVQRFSLNFFLPKENGSRAREDLGVGVVLHRGKKLEDRLGQAHLATRASEDVLL